MNRSWVLCVRTVQMDLEQKRSRKVASDYNLSVRSRWRFFRGAGRTSGK
jgi:hypothetical protein